MIRRLPWKWVGVCLLTGALLGWYIHSQLAARAFDWQLAIGAFSRLRWRWLGIGLLPVFATYYGRALRWEVFLRPQKDQPSMRNLLVATVIGFTAITLFGRAGDFVRPYLIAKKEKVPLSSQLASWLLERVFDLLMASLLLSFVLSRIHGSDLHTGAQLGWVLAFGGKIVAVACTVVFGALFGLRHFTDRFRRWVLGAAGRLPDRWFPRVEKLVKALLTGVESIRSDAALLLILVYSVLEWALIAACYWCVAQAFSDLINLTFVDVLILMGFVSFGGVVQIPGVGGGTQVVAILVLTDLYGVRLELATEFALLLWIITFVAIVPVGLALALKEGLDWHSLRRVGPGVAE